MAINQTKISEYVGKIIDRIEKGGTYITIHFIDGSEMTIRSVGTEEQWIEVD